MPLIDRWPVSPEEREELRATVLTKIYQDCDYSVGRFMFFNIIVMVLSGQFGFGSLFVGICLFGKGEWETVASRLLMFFFFSLFVAFLYVFRGFAIKKMVPREIQLRRSVLVIIQKDGTVIRIPYSHCRWSRRTCFAFYGQLTGLSQRGLLFYLPGTEAQELSLLPVPLSPAEKSRWIEKLHASCQETKPAYLRIFAIMIVPTCVFVPAFIGLGLMQCTLLPLTAFFHVFFSSLVGGIICGISGVKLAFPPEARHLATIPYLRFLERWGGLIWITIFGVGTPLFIVTKAVNDISGIVWYPIFWGLQLVLTGSLSDLLYRSASGNIRRRALYGTFNKL